MLVMFANTKQTYLIYMLYVMYAIAYITYNMYIRYVCLVFANITSKELQLVIGSSTIETRRTTASKYSMWQ